MAIFWNYIMSMYDEFEIQKLLLLLQKLASKKRKHFQTSSGSSEARVGGTGYLQKRWALLWSKDSTTLGASLWRSG